MQNLFSSLLIFFSILFVRPVFSQSIDSDIVKINDIRFAHFEQGKILDTVILEGFAHSRSKLVRNLANFVKAIYDLENYRYQADREIVEIASDKKWMNDSLVENYASLAIDDLFRVCMVTKRYMLFHRINTLLFYDKPLNLISFSYDTYIFLKVGSLYQFLDFQNKIKNLVIERFEKIKIEYSEELFDRLKFNIISIGLSNYDTLKQVSFFRTLSNHVNNEIDSTVSFEKLLFAYELSNYNIIKGYNEIGAVAYRKLIHEYSSPFLLNVTYNIFTWTSEAKKIFLKLLFWNNYPVETIHLQTLEYYIIDYELFSQERITDLSILGKFDSDLYGVEEAQNEIPDLSFVDSVLKLNYFFEPNWIYLELDYSLRQEGHLRQQVDAINDRDGIKKSNYSRQIVEVLSKRYINYKQIDAGNLFDCTNIYLGSYVLISHYYKLSNADLQKDTSQYLVFDSIYRVMSFCQKTNYFKTNGSTVDKNKFIRSLGRFQRVLLAIFKSSKKYDFYETLSDVLDMSDFVSDTIPPQLRIVKDKYRYLNFIANSANDEIRIFDSIYIAQLTKYLLNPKFDTAKYQNRFYLFNDISKNILLDIYSRRTINDSIFINLLAYQEIISQLINKFSEDYSVINQSENSYIPISSYKNPYFCIDNSSIKIISEEDSLFFKTYHNFIKLDKNKSLVDSNYQAIWFFIADDFSNLKSNDNLSKDFNATSKCIYVIFADSSVHSVKKLITLDSLKKIVDFDLPKSAQYFNISYFSDINSNSNLLYTTLLSPLEKFIKPDKTYKLVLPAALLTLPLDYIFAKKNGFLPHFVEYSDISNILVKDFGPFFNENDTTAVFSEMLYNNVYCNINQAYSPLLRSGIVELKYSKVESDSIAQNITSLKILGHKANKRTFIECLSNKSISSVHLITHGAYISHTNNESETNNSIISSNQNTSGVPSIPSERQLLLFSSDSSLTMSKNNILVSYEIRYLENLSHIKLVFLSACETGLIDDTRSYSTGYSGFVREFLDRGVNSIIATRWKIQDNFASEFAIHFYKNLKKYKDYELAFYHTKFYYFTNNVNPSFWTSYVFVK